MKLTKQEAERIFLNHYMLVRQVAMKTAPVCHVQEDIAHDAFVDFLSKYDQWDYDPTTIKALLIRITKVIALQYWRNYLKNLPERLREATEYIWQESTLRQEQDQADWDEQLAAMETCLQKLSKENRDLVDAYYFGKASWKSLADEKKVKSGTLRMKMSRIRSLLYNCIKKVMDVGIKDE